MLSRAYGAPKNVKISFAVYLGFRNIGKKSSLVCRGRVRFFFFFFMRLIRGEKYETRHCLYITQYMNHEGPLGGYMICKQAIKLAISHVVAQN